MPSFGQSLQADALPGNAGSGTLAPATHANGGIVPILVAEDNRLNGLLMAEQLRMLGFSAEIVVSGHEALAQWRSGRYAALLTDIQMPEMDGYELAASIRAEEAGGRARTPIIALTANAPPERSARWKSAGIDDYLMKPAELGVLKATLDRWLNDSTANATVAGPAAAPLPGGAEPVDPRTLPLMVGSDPGVLAEFLAAFSVSAEKARISLGDATRTSRLAQAESVAHQLKSSASAIGAARLAELCAATETAAAAADAPRVAALQAELASELRRVDAWIVARVAALLAPTGTQE